MNQWKCVFKTSNALKAELLKNELLNNDIPTVIVNKQDSNYLIGNYEVHTPENQELIAKVIIEIFNQDDQPI
jgi:hypothetical protein